LGQLSSIDKAQNLHRQ